MVSFQRAACGMVFCLGALAQGFVIGPCLSTTSSTSHVSRNPIRTPPREALPRPIPREALPRPICIAVLRDVPLERAEEVVRALCKGGFRMVSIAQESKDFGKILRSISRTFPDLLVGASSVTTPDEVDAAFACGVNFVSSTFYDPAIVKRTKDLGLLSVPGVSTPAQAASAVQAGGDILKVYPAIVVSGNRFRDIVDAVETSNIPVVISGGLEPEQLQSYSISGASGFVVGRTLVEPEKGSDEIADKAREFLVSWTKEGDRH